MTYELTSLGGAEEANIIVEDENGDTIRSESISVEGGQATLSLDSQATITNITEVDERWAQVTYGEGESVLYTQSMSTDFTVSLYCEVSPGTRWNHIWGEITLRTDTGSSSFEYEDGTVDGNWPDNFTSTLSRSGSEFVEIIADWDDESGALEVEGEIIEETPIEDVTTNIQDVSVRK